MPQLTHVLTDEELERGRRVGGMDLAPYLAIITTIREQGGRGGVLTLGEGENQRTEKRRMSVAAKQQGLELTWRKAPEGQLRFVLAEPGQPRPDGRRRQQREAAEENGGSPPAAPAGNGRRRQRA